ncbi:ABC transporter ATP-binding protein [Streptomyces sp. CBMA29]|uniref:ABC transporter ATP-binding protein n=1 Tax=Streptomyces sp. CBMA29 TaxID=1896314 RepID=UPI002948C3D9|nr:ABC transporter ATP-binding protein [Streptomyces sp. CBMA29]
MRATQRRGEFSELRLDGLTCVYNGSVVALDSMTATIKAGEFTALLGPSGCGKSTLLGCLAGHVTATEGRLWVDDERIDQRPAEKRGFGMVFQNYALFPHLSVAKNVAFGLEVRRMPKPEVRERVKWALDLVQLPDYADNLPGRLSGGQQQRVAIARALAPRPSIMLMDEPLSNLDAKLRFEMRSEIRQLHDELGLTTVYVTHDQEEALSIADRIIVLRKGKTVQDGTPQQIYSEPEADYVADFVGYRNRLQAHVAGGTGREPVVEGHGIRLRATSSTDLRPGQSVTVRIRPEEVSVTDSASAVNAFEAVARSTQYHGRDFTVQAELPDGATLSVRTPVRPETGTVLRLSIPVASVRAFAAGEASTAPAEGSDDGESTALEPSALS